jgi:hypothetical protein
MDHARICQEYEKQNNLKPDKILGDLTIIERYFSQLNGYKGSYVVAMKVHIIRTFVYKGYKRKSIQKALKISHCSICHHLDNKLKPYQEDFIKNDYEKCITHSLVPVRINTSTHAYELIHISEFKTLIKN